MPSIPTQWALAITGIVWSKQREWRRKSGEDEIIMQINHRDSLMTVILATEYIYGNAIRDASGLLDIKDFTNTTDLNSISEELNKTVRTRVLPAFKKQVKQGDKIEVTGAVEFNKEHISLRIWNYSCTSKNFELSMLVAKNISKKFSGVTALGQY